MVDEAIGRSRVREPNLRLGRGDVDVHIAARGGQEEKHRRMPVGSDRVARGLSDRPCQGAVLDRTAIDEEILEPAAGESDGAAGHEPRQPQGSRARFELLEVSQRLAAEDLQDARSAVHGGGRIQGLPAVGPQGKSHGRIGQGSAHDGRSGGARLRLGLPEELPAGRGMREEPFDEHVGSARPAGRLFDGFRSVLDPEADRLGRRTVAGGQGEFRHGGDRGKRLAAETVAVNLRQVSIGGDLGRRVPLEREPSVLRRHPAAVVAHEDALGSSALEIHLDARCSGVQSILDQLLDDRGRALHNLAGGDPVDDLAREPVDLRHFVGPESLILGP